MLFNSWSFLVEFFPVAVMVFYLIPERFRFWRKLWLILASLYFYGSWNINYLPILLFSVFVNYAIAEAITRFPARGRDLLILGLAVNLGLLGYFKYTNFSLDLLGLAMRQDFGHFNIILPLAISFFTFTQISYLVDVYRDRNVHYRFLDYSLFVVLFPHLIAGPIVRHWEIIPQFADRDLKSNRDNLSIGLTLFMIGMMKKFLADLAAFYANLVYDGLAQHAALSSLDAWIGTLAFTLQIYFDFSSYSDMAIGLARMFGIIFPSNFDSPYCASSIIAFWERWHRTLTRFLREYVYFSLGGNRKGYLRQMFNIMATMLLSGLWHGAGWTYLIWGGLHGFYLIVNHQTRFWIERMQWNLQHWTYQIAGTLITLFAISIAWTFFRAATAQQAGAMLSLMLGFHGFSLPEELVHGSHFWGHSLGHLGLHFIETKELQIKHYGNAVIKILFLFLICWIFPNSQQLLTRYRPILEPVSRPAWFQLKLSFFLGIVLGFIAFLFIRNSIITEPNPFIYFNF